NDCEVLRMIIVEHHEWDGTCLWCGVKPSFSSGSSGHAGRTSFSPGVYGYSCPVCHRAFCIYESGFREWARVHRPDLLDEEESDGSFLKRAGEVLQRLLSF